MKNNFTLLISLFLFVAGNSLAQVSFTNTNSRLSNSSFHSGCPVAVADWNGDGLDDIIRMDEGHDCYVEVQRTNGQFETFHLGDFGGGSGWAWAMAVGDFDRNGYLDIVAGGSGPAVKYILSNSNGTGTITSMPNTGFFVQNITLADFNNDGWIDLFTCDDNDESHIFLNATNGTFTESFTTIDFDVTNTDDSGNYGSVWTDFDNDGDMDLYIAKCRQGVNSPTDGRRINVMFVNDGNNNFTEDAASYNLAIGWQSWTASFGDIDNDGDLDLLVTNHDNDSQILENDGTGHYTDITATTGFDISDITPIQSVMEDFDNDGYVDLFITGSDHRFYRNNGNKTFSKVDGLFNSEEMESFAIGDLNHDGLIDIYASYAGIYTNPSNIDDVVWFNRTSNSNHFLTVDLKGTASNPDAIGGRVYLYGSWGVQVREVYSGESYGRSNTSMLHFGLDSATVIDSMVVNFPSGLTQTIINPAVDQFIHIIEGDCVSPEISLTYSLQDFIICSGTTQTLTVTPGFNYFWSDSSTADTLVISAGGEYNVIVTETGNNCPAVSKTIEIIEDPDQTPVIGASGDLEFCDGDAVMLDAGTGVLTYMWSSGQTTPVIMVNQSGQYYVTVMGFCSLFTSDTVTVTSHLVPDPVTNTTVSITGPSSATLTATGTLINWYDSQTAVVPLDTGATFTTPVLTSDTDYWVENSENYGGGLFNTGIENANTATYSGNTTNALMYFDVTEACVLKSVKVYTDFTGTRRFELRDGNTVLQFADVAVAPDSQVVTLNFNLTPGSYTLATNGSINQAMPGWGNVAPRFLRHNSGVNYPYTIPDAISITGNSIGSQYYYYFYDWQVEKPGLTCYSDRIQINVLVTTGLTELSAAGISLYPNPAMNELNIRQDSNREWRLQLFDATGRLVSEQWINNMNQQISLQGYAPGVYQVMFSNEQQQISTRIVKQ